MSQWLTIIGVGLGGTDGLSSEARHAIGDAEVVAGSQRQLDLLGIDSRQRYVWPSPLADGLAHVQSLEGRPVVVLASGDPMHYGVGATLAQALEPDAYKVLPAPSAFGLAAARMGWALQDVLCLSLHGRPLETLHSAVGPNEKLLLLTSDGDAPCTIMGLLLQAGYGQSRISVLESLGGVDETRHDLLAEEHDFRTYAALNVVAVDCRIDEDVQFLPCVPGLPDGAFLHDGQLTKREIRAATVAALVPTTGQRLWDVGAGSGSVAIEWLRSAPRGRAVAFEREAERVAMIQHNALRLGVPQLAVVEGCAPDVLEGQARPDAIFLGGSVADDNVFNACWRALPSSGRMVANAVTLEGEAALSERHSRFGGELLGIATSHVKSIGRYRAMEPAMTVTQWRVQKS